jgi:hypothetical protein
VPKNAVESAYSKGAIWWYLRTDFQQRSALYGAVFKVSGTGGEEARKLRIHLAKLYVRPLPATLTNRSFKYVNTEMFPGKLLSTAVEKSTKTTDIRGTTTISHAIYAM